MSAPWYQIERLWLYVYRCRRHRGWATINGYTGITNHLHFRDRQHQVKPWYDTVRYRIVIPLGVMPRFLGLALEFLLIKVTLPLYNVQHNRGNPRRVRPDVARIQRATRDLNPGMARLIPSPFVIIVPLLVAALALYVL